MSISRQLRWARKMKHKGRCALCGAQRNKYAHRCDKCERRRKVRHGVQ